MVVRVPMAMPALVVEIQFLGAPAKAFCLVRAAFFHDLWPKVAQGVRAAQQRLASAGMRVVIFRGAFTAITMAWR